MLAMRSQRLEALARRFLGPVTGAVYGALLRALEAKCEAFDRDQEDSVLGDEDKVGPSANIRAVEQLLDPDLDLASALQGFSSDGSRDADPEFAELGIKPESAAIDDDEDKTKGLTRCWY